MRVKISPWLTTLLMKFNVSCGHKKINQSHVCDWRTSKPRPEKLWKKFKCWTAYQRNGSEQGFWVWLGGCDKMGKVKSSNHYQQHAEEKCKSVAWLTSFCKEWARSWALRIKLLVGEITGLPDIFRPFFPPHNQKNCSDGRVSNFLEIQTLTPSTPFTPRMHWLHL